MKDQTYDDGLIVQYLLGYLSEEEREPLDELSLTDDSFAARLLAVENDLTDSYVKGELSGPTLARFESHYLASPLRREKVKFAQTLLSVVDSAAEPTVASRPASIKEASWLRLFGGPGASLRWAFAAAAMLLVLTSGYLLLQNTRLRNELLELQAQRAEVEAREKDLQARLELAETIQRELHDRTNERIEQNKTAADTERRGENEIPDSNILAMNLSPPTRGAGQIPTVALTRAIQYLAVRLELESDEFPQYRVVLKNPATGQAQWQSSKLAPVSRGQAKAVSFRMPARGLTQQNYLLEVSGIRKDGTTEIFSSYPFKVVIK